MVSELGPGPQSWASGFTTLYASHEQHTNPNEEKKLTLTLNKDTFFFNM